VFVSLKLNVIPLPFVATVLSSIAFTCKLLNVRSHVPGVVSVAVSKTKDPTLVLPYGACSTVSSNSIRAAIGLFHNFPRSI
jgi:hypothetical protein